MFGRGSVEYVPHAVATRVGAGGSGHAVLF